MPRLLLPRLTAGVRELLRRFVPAALGAGVVQVNLLIDLWVASFLSTGAISWLYYADRVNQLPLGVVGIAVGSALLPLLSRQIEARDEAGANESQSRAIELVMVLTLPAAAALMVIAHPVISALFERGAFNAADSEASAAALRAFAAGLPAYVLLKVLAPAFFARKDPGTVLKIAAVGLLSNVAVMLALVWSLGHVGIALATATAAWINAIILLVVLMRRGHFKADMRLKQRLPRMVAATSVMAATLAAAHQTRDHWWLAADDHIALYLVDPRGTRPHRLRGHRSPVRCLGHLRPSLDDEKRGHRDRRRQAMSPSVRLAVPSSAAPAHRSSSGLVLRAIPAGRRVVNAFTVDDDTREVLALAVTCSGGDGAGRSRARL